MAPPGPRHPDWPKVLTLRRVLEERYRNKTLAHCCGTAAVALNALLREARPVVGRFWWRSFTTGCSLDGQIITPRLYLETQSRTNCWVMWHGCLLDITATQFEPFAMRPVVLLKDPGACLHYMPRVVGAAAEDELLQWLSDDSLNSILREVRKELKT